MDEAELAFAGIARQAELIAAGEVSSRDLVALYLRRIERFNGELNAFRVVFAEKALLEAEQADARRRAGAAEGGAFGGRPLLGVPIAVKDNIDVAGEVTANGTRAYGDPAGADAEIVRRVRAAGAVVIGKTHVPELCAMPWTESATWGVTRNPWNLDHTPGGSSGGSAAAVAAGLVGAALGTDGGGSVRFPAAYCGLFGLKSQRGRLPLAPDLDACQGLSVNGVLTRTVRDTALFYDAVAEGQRDAGAPLLEPISLLAALDGAEAEVDGRGYATAGAGTTAGRVGEHAGSAVGGQGAAAGSGPVGGGYAASSGSSEGLPAWGHAEARAPQRSSHPLRVGLTTNLPPSPLTRLHPANAAALGETAELLRGLGHEVRDCKVDRGPLEPSLEFTARFISAAHDDAQKLAHPEHLERRTRMTVALGSVLGRVAVGWARAREAAEAARLNRPFAECDVLLMPVTPAPPPRIGRCEGRGWLYTLLMAHATVPYAAPWNLTGQPAASVPAGIGAGGLPRAVQLVGPPGSEMVLVRLAAELEAARPWAQRRPAAYV